MTPEDEASPYRELSTLIANLIGCSEMLLAALAAGEETLWISIIEKIDLASKQLLAQVNHFFASPISTPSEPLASQIRHDLRSPLTVIIGYSELLLEEMDSQWHPDLHRIRAIAGQILDLTRQIVLEDSKLHLRP